MSTAEDRRSDAMRDAAQDRHDGLHAPEGTGPDPDCEWCADRELREFLFGTDLRDAPARA